MQAVFFMINPPPNVTKRSLRIQPRYRPDWQRRPAEVFKAYDRQRGKFVALKKFHAADSLKYGIREEFQKSINFAHGNIVRAYDFFTIVQEFVGGGTHETQYGVMELIEGGDLADYLKKKPSNEELLEVVKGILRGLDYLHTPDPNTDKRRIIHRDIKPGIS